MCPSQEKHTIYSMREGDKGGESSGAKLAAPLLVAVGATPKGAPLRLRSLQYRETLPRFLETERSSARAPLLYREQIVKDKQSVKLCVTPPRLTPDKTRLVTDTLLSRSVVMAR